MDDTISRQAAIEDIKECAEAAHSNYEWDMEQGYINAIECLEALPSAETEPAIPLSWIEGQIKWLKSLDNAFSTLTVGQISAMVNKWKDEQE